MHIAVGHADFGRQYSSHPLADFGVAQRPSLFGQRAEHRAQPPLLRRQPRQRLFGNRQPPLVVYVHAQNQAQPQFQIQPRPVPLRRGRLGVRARQPLSAAQRQSPALRRPQAAYHQRIKRPQRLPSLMTLAEHRAHKPSIRPYHIRPVVLPRKRRPEVLFVHRAAQPLREIGEIVQRLF